MSSTAWFLKEDDNLLATIYYATAALTIARARWRPCRS